MPSPLSVGFVTVFEFAAFLRKFSLELVSHQSKQFLFSVELGQPRENRSNSGKLLGSEICATNWKKCIELSISVSNDHRGKKKCYVGRSWCIKPNLLCQTGQKNCLEILEAGFRAESLPRSDKFEWFKCLMHLRFLSTKPLKSLKLATTLAPYLQSSLARHGSCTTGSWEVSPISANYGSNTARTRTD